MRLLLAHRDAGGTTAETLAKELNSVEVAAGREALHMGAVLGLLEELAKRDFVTCAVTFGVHSGYNERRW